MEASLIGKVINKYRIDAKIGEGGMGIVYKAWDLESNSAVALKMISPGISQDEEFCKRFKKEVEAQAKLRDNPNVVSVYGLYDTASGLLIVMQYVEGVTLANKIKQAGPMPCAKALPIIKQSLAAIHHVHQAKILHRDIKPSNIMLTPEGVVKIMDFGLAKIQPGEDLTKSRVVAGSLPYMSPEQARGLVNVDLRSDIYSIGMTFYELLAGRTPFEKNSTEAEIIYAILEKKFPPPDQYNSAVPKDLAEIVMKAIAKNPAIRFQSAEEMLKAIESFEIAMKEATVRNSANRPQSAEEVLKANEDFKGKTVRQSESPALKPGPDPDKDDEKKTKPESEKILQEKPQNDTNKKQDDMPHRFSWRGFTKVALSILVMAALIMLMLSRNDREKPSAVIMELAGISEVNVLQEKLIEYRNSFRIAFGPKEAFEPPDGCYVFVVDTGKVWGVYKFADNLFYDLKSEEKLSGLSERFSGKAAIWIKDLTAKSSSKTSLP